MPIISIFFGIVIRINFSDHNPPHLHADYQGYESLVRYPNRRGHRRRPATRLVFDWIAANRAALAENWDRAYNDKPTSKIPGLDQE